MNPEPNGPALDPSRATHAHLLRRAEKAGLVGALAFLVALGLMWMNHPLLLNRHLDRVLVQCGGAALLTFVTCWLVYSLKDLER